MKVSLWSGGYKMRSLHISHVIETNYLFHNRGLYYIDTSLLISSINYLRHERVKSENPYIFAPTYSSIFAHWRHQHAVTHLENVHQLNDRWGKKLDISLLHRQPLIWNFLPVTTNQKCFMQKTSLRNKPF